MCVKTLFATATGVNYIFGGFEDGNIVIWDERKTSVELSHCQVFSDPGTYIIYALLSISFAVILTN